MRTFGTAIAIAVGLLISGASPASAAKGVKKKDGEEVKHGIVVSVVHHTAAKAKKGAPATPATETIGEVVVKTKQSKKKGQAATTGAKTASHTFKYTVGKETKVTSVHGKQTSAIHFSTVKAGDHVVLHVKANHAESIAVHHMKVKKKKS